MKKQEKLCILPALVLFLAAVLYFARPVRPAPFVPKPIAAPTAVRLNINTADRASLEDIPGIGPVLANAILSRRAELGGFSSPDGLLTVSGIGESRLAGIERYITY